MEIVRLTAFVVGLAVVAFAFGISIRTFMMPGSGASLGTRIVFRLLQYVFVGIARPLGDRQREAVLSLYAPVCLLTMLALCIGLVTAGFTLLFVGAGVDTLGDAFFFSISSVSTLGFASPANNVALMLLTVLAAMSAATTIALLIGYLPTIFANYTQREQAIAALEAHVGNASSAVAVLSGWARSPGLDRLEPLWAEWTQWFATLGTVHSSLSGALFLRSPAPHRCWVTTSGAVLDAASLFVAALDHPSQPAAERCIKAGATALRQIVTALHVPCDPDPTYPKTPVTVTREEFAAACDALAKAGLPVTADRAGAWVAFAERRVTYDRALMVLCRIKMAPAGLWSSDRDEAKAPLPVPVLAGKRRRVGRPEAGTA